ncbi:MAG: decarboxylating 6-phosphogluconate dehydrogenase [Phycisphaerales bacterium]|nr:decarboxylating 6-phosphogluconate dehydrogenase [Phycisphaerales bacterium]
MQLGMIGLGRMGANMTKRLLRAGHQVVVFDRSSQAVADLAKEGATASTSAADLVTKLASPRHVWLMIPAAFVDAAVDELAGLVAKGDTIVDGGNSYYKDDIRRAKALAAKGIHYVDCGTSGGVWGLDRGYSQMIGGDSVAVSRLDSIFKALAPGKASAPPTPGRVSKGTAEEGYLHCGPPGAGHFVKMVHNGIEYGLMAAYAEGLNVLRHANAGLTTRVVDAETTPLREPGDFQYEFDLAEVTEVWRRGSVVASWLLDLTAQAFASDRTLEAYSGRVSDSGEGRWTVLAAIEEGVPVHVISAALMDRFESRGQSEFANKVLSAMRMGFGGHLEKAAGS